MQYNLRLLNNNTIAVRVGRHREYVGIDGKTKGQIFDAVRWALISKNVVVSEARLTEDLYELLRRH